MKRTYLLLEEIHDMRSIYLKAIKKQHKVWRQYFANTNKLRRYLQEHPADLKKKAEYDKYMCLRVTAYDIEQKLTEEREELYRFARGKKNRDQKRMKYLIKRYKDLKEWIQEDWRLEVE